MVDASLWLMKISIYMYVHEYINIVTLQSGISKIVVISIHDRYNIATSN